MSVYNVEVHFGPLLLTPGTYRLAVADDTTPDITDAAILGLPANTGATEITALDGGAAGRVIMLLGLSDTNAATISDGGNFDLEDDWVSGVGHTLTLGTNDGVAWTEAGRVPTILPDAPITNVSSSPYAPTDSESIVVDATSGAITINLPAAASNSGKTYDVKKEDSSANAVTLDGNGVETIDGATTFALTHQHESVTVRCDGTEWWIL